MSVDFTDPPTLNVSSANITFLGNTSEFGYDVAKEIGGSPIRGSQTIIEGDNILDLSAVVPPPELGGVNFFTGTDRDDVAWSCALSSVFYDFYVFPTVSPPHDQIFNHLGGGGPRTQIQGYIVQNKWLHTVWHPSSGCRRPAYQNAGRKTLHHDEPGHLFNMEVPWPSTPPVPGLHVTSGGDHGM